MSKKVSAREHGKIELAEDLRKKDKIRKEQDKKESQIETLRNEIYRKYIDDFCVKGLKKVCYVAVVKESGFTLLRKFSDPKKYSNFRNAVSVEVAYQCAEKKRTDLSIDWGDGKTRILTIRVVDVYDIGMENSIIRHAINQRHGDGESIFEKIDMAFPRDCDILDYETKSIYSTLKEGFEKLEEDVIEFTKDKKKSAPTIAIAATDDAVFDEADHYPLNLYSYKIAQVVSFMVNTLNGKCEISFNIPKCACRCMFSGMVIFKRKVRVMVFRENVCKNCQQAIDKFPAENVFELPYTPNKRPNKATIQEM